MCTDREPHRHCPDKRNLFFISLPLNYYPRTRARLSISHSKNHLPQDDSDNPQAIMTHTHKSEVTAKPSLMQRLKGNHDSRTTKTTVKNHKNPLTGDTTTTRTEKVTEHPSHHTTSTGPMASSHRTTNGGGGFTNTSGRTTRSSGLKTGTTTGGSGILGGGSSSRAGGIRKQKPTAGDKMSGAMTKMKGSLTGKPGLKAAGARREHGY